MSAGFLFVHAPESCDASGEGDRSSASNIAAATPKRSLAETDSGGGRPAAFSMRISCDVDEVPDGKGGKVKVGVPDAVDEVCASPDHNMDRVGNTSLTDLSDGKAPFAAGICPGEIAKRINADPALKSMLKNVDETGYTQNGGNGTGALSGLCLRIANGSKSTIVRAVDALQPGQDCITSSGRMHIDLHACSLKELGFNQPGAKSENGGKFQYQDGSTWTPVPCPVSGSPEVVLKTNSAGAYEIGVRDTPWPVRSIELPNGTTVNATPNGTFKVDLKAGQTVDMKLKLVDGGAVPVTVTMPSSVPQSCEKMTACPADAPAQHPAGTVLLSRCEVAATVAGASAANGGGDGDRGSPSGLSPTDCNDKGDGWWCLAGAGGSPYMAYCRGRAIAGGCPCASCSSAGVKASCSAEPPPSACPST